MKQLENIFKIFLVYLSFGLAFIFGLFGYERGMKILDKWNDYIFKNKSPKGQIIMTSQEASGSFMLRSDVVNYMTIFAEGDLDWLKVVYWLQNDVEVSVIDGQVFIPTKWVSHNLTEQEWKTMQSKVTTSIFGLTSL